MAYKAPDNSRVRLRLGTTETLNGIVLGPPISGENLSVETTLSGNVCNFDTAYEPPLGNAVDFDVRGASAAVRFTSGLGSKWEVLVGGPTVSHLGQKWEVDAFKAATSGLNQKWTVPSTIPATSGLGSNWSVFKFDFVTSHLGQKWEIDPVAVKGKTSGLGQKWEALAVKKQTSGLQENWKIFIREKTTSGLGSKWEIDPVALKSESGLQNNYKIFIRTKEQSGYGAKWQVLAPQPDTSGLGQNWAIDPVAIKSLTIGLNQKWIVDAGPFNAWVLPYALEVANSWTLPYNAIVEQAWILPSTGLVEQSWEMPYSLSTDLGVAFEMVWDLDTGDDLAQSWILPYSSGVVSQSWSLDYSLTTPVVEAWNLPYSLTFPVQQDWSIDWDINTFDPVQKDWKLVYAWIGPEILNVTGEPTITLTDIFGNPVVLDVFEAVISTDEEGFIWQADITLLNIDDYKLININDQFVLDFYGESFTLIAESKTLDRADPVGVAMTVRAVSPAIKHDFPRAEPCTVSYTTDRMAKDIAEEIIGETITWSIPDWLIPANRLGIADGAPIQVVKQIVEAVGGVLESNPDGTLVARPKYPVSMNILENKSIPLSIDQNYFDTADNLSVSEEYTPQKLFNKFKISDTKAGFSDDLDFDFDEITEEDGSVTKSDTEGLLKAFVSPFREDIVIKSSQDASIGFQSNGVNTEQLTELVEIKDGVGSVSKPIFTLDSFTYEAEDLGTPTFVVDDNMIFTPSPTLKYGLVEVTYTTRFVEYDVTGVNGKNVQFRIEEPIDV